MNNLFENDFTGETYETYDSTDTTILEEPTQSTVQETIMVKYGPKISARQLSKETGACASFIFKLSSAGKIERHPATTDKRVFYTLEAIQIIKDIKAQRFQRGDKRRSSKAIVQNVLNEMQTVLDNMQKLDELLDTLDTRIANLDTRITEYAQVVNRLQSQTGDK